MVQSLTDLKRNRATSLQKLTSEASKLSSKASNNADERFWQPGVDKSGNGYAVIRFLPAAQGEDIPWVRLWDHGFKGPGGWYIEKSLTTLGQADPVSEYNSVLWNSTNDDESPARKQAREQKRRLYYIANILVVKDSANPANEGKVFLYRFGKKIFDKINNLMNPQYEEDEARNPFDLWNGCNLKLKIRTVSGFRNYDNSEFDAPSAVASSDEEIEEIWKQEYSLQAFLDPGEFKSYSELKTRLNKVLGLNAVNEEPVAEYEERSVSSSKASTDDDDNDSDDDDLARFRRMAEED